MLFDVGNSHSSDANRTSKQLPASATIDSSSDRDRIDLAGGDGGGRGLDPAAVWLIYSKMNLNSFDAQSVHSTSRGPVKITRRPPRRSTTTSATTTVTTILPSVLTVPADLMTNQTVCRLEMGGQTVRDFTVGNDDDDDVVVVPVNRQMSQSNDSSEHDVSNTSSAEGKKTLLSVGQPHVTQPGQVATSQTLTSNRSPSGTADDNDDENSDEDELDEDAPTEQKLMYKLMRHYEKSVRPVRNASDTVLVRMGLTLTQIFNMVLPHQRYSSCVFVKSLARLKPHSICKHFGGSYWS